MFRIGIMPTQSDEYRTLIATTEEWVHFQEYLRQGRRGVLAAHIVLDMSAPTNKIEVPVEIANDMLEAAGVSY